MSKMNTKTAQMVKLFLISVVTGLTFVSLLSTSTYNLGPFMIEAELKIIDHGLTTIDLSPIGEVSAETHSSPVKLNVNLESMDLDKLTKLVMSPPKEDLVLEFENQIHSIIRSFSIKLIVLGGAGGFFGTLISGYRNRDKLLFGTLFPTLVIIALLLLTFFTYDVNAFENPEFDGVLEAYPWVMGVVDDSLRALDDVSLQLQTLSENLFMFFEKVRDLEGLGAIEGDHKVLHVSDIHNNPASLDLVAQIVRNFQVDMIIDTGDITDYGSPLEAELASRISGFNVPYVFISGNHDSPQVIKRLESVENVHAINNKEIIEVLDFKIAGIEDPSADSTAMTVPDESFLDDYAIRLEQLIEEKGVEPDILGVHHPHIAEHFREDIPIILTGHTHRPDVDKEEGELIVNAGTTGAAGIRGLEGGADIPYSMAVLHFNRDKKPVAIDLIKVRHLESGYRIERFVVEEYLR
ncbi:metallophosphoesterase family protein [Natranaerobius trueperi]|uniref:Calcineurin-like phosphoesterase domain-containing protein n=1 Tax=Natranaerobius trueperi TaxID=759412 RepID=A0A226BYC0_9FIRM|nr:metallophosphoesterase [Natranaerobius trueperi]OWZ83117.1 hypothetical protein CDO51_10475 [Natranaerobius trueperi]